MTSERTAIRIATQQRHERMRVAAEARRAQAARVAGERAPAGRDPEAVFQAVVRRFARRLPSRAAG